MIYEKIKKTFVAALACFSLLGMVMPANVKADSVKDYVIIPLLRNEGTPEVITEVVRSTKESKSRVVLKFGYNSPRSDADITKSINGLTENEVQEAVDSKDFGASNSGDYLEFPGPEDTVSNKDYEQARSIAQAVTDSLNRAVNVVFEKGTGLPNKDEKGYAEVIRQIANAASKGNTATIYGVKFTFGNDGENNKAFTNSIIADIQNKYLKSSDPTYFNLGATEADFVVLEYADGKEVLQFSFPKGYSEGQALYNKDNESGNEYITWKGIGWYVCKGYSLGLFYGTQAFITNSDLSNTINEMIYNALSGFLGLLGVKNVETLILNRGRANSYFMGMMPTSWFSVGSVLFWAAQIIAIIILFGSVVKLLLKRNVAIISTAERVSLKEGIVDVAITIFLLVMFVPIFYILARTNYILVETFASLVGADSLALVSSASGLAGILVMIFTVCILLILNVQYFGRQVTLLVLYICSPIAISSIAFSGRKSSLFSNWFKELMVNLFIQSLNAAVLALFIIMSRYSQFSALEGILMISAFIPLNRYVKDNIGGMNGHGGESVSGEMKQAAAATLGMGAITTATATPELVKAGSAAINGAKNPSEAVEALRDSKINKASIQQTQKIEAGKAAEIKGPEKEGSIGMLSKAKQSLSNVKNNTIDKIVSGPDNLAKTAIGAVSGAAPHLSNVKGTLERAALVTMAGAVASELDTNVGKSLQHEAMEYGLNPKNELINTSTYQYTKPMNEVPSRRTSEYGANFDLTGLTDNKKEPMYVDKTGVIHSKRDGDTLENNGRSVRFAPMNREFIDQYCNGDGLVDFEAIQKDVSYAAMVKDEAGHDYIGMAYTVSSEEMGLRDPKISALSGEDFAERCVAETEIMNQKAEEDYQARKQSSPESGNNITAEKPIVREAVAPQRIVDMTPTYRYLDKQDGIAKKAAENEKAAQEALNVQNNTSDNSGNRN